MTAAERPRIYIIDDDASVRRALARLVRSADMEACVCASAHEFLSVWEPRPNACLVTDIMMPELDGLDLQARLVADGFALPVIFITAFDCAETRDSARRSGAVSYLSKPVDGQALLDSIQWALAHRSD
jgi:FixJ family two-component response regulator